MLLSMLISFLLARRFGGKTCFSLLTVFTILLTVFSVGLPSVDAYWRYTYWKYLVELKYPLPLSFPFYASVFVPFGLIEFAPGPSPHYYLIYFLTFKIQELGLPVVFEHFILFQSFFLLVNFMGAIFSYGISKTAFIDRYFTRRTCTLVLILLVILASGSIATLISRFYRQNLSQKLGVSIIGYGFPLSWCRESQVVYPNSPTVYSFSLESFALDIAFWSLIISVLIAVAFKWFKTKE